MRQPQVMPPSPLAMAIKKILRVPVYAVVRYPIEQNQWFYRMERIA